MAEVSALPHQTPSVRLPASVRDNLYFMIAEVSAQIAYLEALLETFSPVIGQRILDRAGYTENLKARIDDSCLEYLVNRCRVDSPDMARATETVAAELEKIAALGRHCVEQFQPLAKTNDPRCRKLLPQVKWIGSTIRLIEPAFEAESSDTALKIGKVAQKLPRALDKYWHRQSRKGNSRGGNGDVQYLFLAHHLTEMANALGRISATIMSVKLGQKIDSHRFRSLRDSVNYLGLALDRSEVRVDTLAETRSGSRIAGIASAQPRKEGYLAVFKDGQKQKLKEERQQVEFWHKVQPGIAPRILNYQSKDHYASLLIEHLPGETFEQLLLHAGDKHYRRALSRLQETLHTVWSQTLDAAPIATDYIGQLRKRLPEVYGVHPDFGHGDLRIGKVKRVPFEQLVEQAQAWEARYPAPFGVLVHGDFNIDNIIYDARESRINYIDLHRSRTFDYVQDLSVFMVSNYRMQVMTPEVRCRIRDIAVAMDRFAADFAQEQGDATYPLRLTLGLARSFATSTRFIRDQQLAASMFYRAHYLLDRLTQSLSAGKKIKPVAMEELFF